MSRYIINNAGLCGDLVEFGGSIGTSYDSGIGGTNLGKACPAPPWPDAYTNCLASPSTCISLCGTPALPLLSMRCSTLGAALAGPQQQG